MWSDSAQHHFSFYRLGLPAWFNCPGPGQFRVVERVAPLNGCPACATAAPPAAVSLTNGYDTQMIAVTASGRVELP